ncbi:MAG: GNAT family N-acetyltransferase [Rhodospirillales bacterium]
MTNIRAAAESDAPAVQKIYAHHVRHGTASFELEPPNVETVRARIRDITAAGCPYLVLEDGDGGVSGVLGFAYASLWRPRPAYRWAVECSVYVHPDMHRKGYGRRLLADLIAVSERAGFRQMIAVIGGGDEHAASIGLHAALGFERAGNLRAVGYKLEGWRDTVLMQRALGPGAETPPDD